MDIWVSERVAIIACPRLTSTLEAVQLGQYIYIFGGRDDNGQNIQDIDRYDATRNRWLANFSTWTTATVFGAAFALPALPDLIYLAGGLLQVGKLLSPPYIM